MSLRNRLQKFSSKSDASNWTISWNRSVEPIYTLGGITDDEKWSFKDSNGHVHTYGSRNKSFTWIETETYWCGDCHDEHTRGEYRCVQCSEVVKPGTKTTSGPAGWIKGPARAYVTDGDGNQYDLDPETLDKWYLSRDPQVIEDFLNERKYDNSTRSVTTRSSHRGS